MTADPPVTPRTVAVPEDVLWQRVEQQIVLLELTSQRYHSLDDVGSQMWEALEACADVTLALERLQEVYDVDPDTLSDDLDAFIRQLIDTGLLTAGD